MSNIERYFISNFLANYSEQVAPASPYCAKDGNYSSESDDRANDQPTAAAYFQSKVLQYFATCTLPQALFFLYTAL